jgi:hypothetical protein
LAGVFVLAQSLYAGSSAGTISIAFFGNDGVPFCDSATLTFSATSSFVSGTHDNWDCKGGEAWLGGVNSTLTGPQPNEYVGSVALSDNVGVLGYGDSAVTLYLNFTNQTFSFYSERHGIGPEIKISNGTFKFVKEAVTAAPTSDASWQAPGILSSDPAFILSGFPSGTYELILYDRTDTEEYCDFFHVTSTGYRVGGYHDFTTGCRLPSNAPTGGDYALLAKDVVVMNAPNDGRVGVAGPSLILTDNSLEIEYEEDIITNYYFNFDKGVWSLYEPGGSLGLQLANYGYFVLVPYNPLKPKLVAPFFGGLPSTTPQSN